MQTAGRGDVYARDIEIDLEILTCDHPLMSRTRERARQKLAQLKAEETQ
jgi:hypothetical protein